MFSKRQRMTCVCMLSKRHVNASLCDDSAMCVCKGSASLTQQQQKQYSSTGCWRPIACLKYQIMFEREPLIIELFCGKRSLYALFLLVIKKNAMKKQESLIWYKCLIKKRHPMGFRHHVVGIYSCVPLVLCVISPFHFFFLMGTAALYRVCSTGLR